MSERRRALSVGMAGSATDLVADLADLDRALTGGGYALVGGLAVLLHTPGHRVTRDVDTAVRQSRAQIGPTLSVVATRSQDQDHDWTLQNNTPLDLLHVIDREPRPGIGRQQKAKLRALRWSVETAEPWYVHAADRPDNGAPVRVATRAALLALKTVAVEAPERNDKRRSDLHDIWRLLQLDVAAAGVDEQELTLGPLAHAHPGVRAWVAQTLRRWMVSKPAEFALHATGPGAQVTAEDVAELHDAFVAPTVESFS